MTLEEAPGSTREVEAERQARTRSRYKRGGGGRFLLRRLGFYSVTAFVAVVLNFMIPRLMPGDPVINLARQIQRQTGAPLTEETLQALYMLYGRPDENIFSQFFNYMSGLLQGDLGISILNYPTPVTEVVGNALPWTVGLVGITTLLAWLIGTALGCWVGFKPGSRLDTILTPGSQFFSAFPAFWVAMLALWLFAFNLGWFPRAGGYDPNVPFEINNVWFLLSVLHYGALPALTLVLVGFASWLFGMRNMTVSTISEDYVVLAKAKGLSGRRVLFGYAARNALLPNITSLAMAIGGIIGGTVLTEIVFTYPGMGQLLLQAVNTQDFPVMQMIFLMLVFTALVANFIVDSIYVLLDPRTRETS
ncbi:ABC transporter permease [Pseudactinotalea sp. Z1748]|uniref:ABC transporter permease n=1 Tax=Pseudactinotalea sp. Z1748 TaxID=3413027 RepID=UPI003C7BE966